MRGWPFSVFILSQRDTFIHFEFIFKAIACIMHAIYSIYTHNTFQKSGVGKIFFVMLLLIKAAFIC